MRCAMPRYARYARRYGYANICLSAKIMSLIRDGYYASYRREDYARDMFIMMLSRGADFATSLMFSDVC